VVPNMNKTLRLEIVTPDATAYSDDVDMVTMPGVEGQLGILPGRIPLMTQMAAGEMIVRKNDQDRFLLVGDGFIEVTGDHVAILTELAIAADNIDEAKAEETRQLAAAQLRETMSAEEVASVNAALVRTLALLGVNRRRRN
jgi:F-type H+-transporting ATPase subunit epsilon